VSRPPSRGTPPSRPFGLAFDIAARCPYIIDGLAPTPEPLVLQHAVGERTPAQRGPLQGCPNGSAIGPRSLLPFWPRAECEARMNSSSSQFPLGFHLNIQFDSEFDSNLIELCSNLGILSNHFKPLNSSGLFGIKI
jgi:hypothetical protein